MLPDISKDPIYIYAPRYRSQSVGIKCLYLLCHYLNCRNQNAYIVLDSESYVNDDDFDRLYYSLNIKYLTTSSFDFYAQNDCSPIAIYTDTVSGNPLNVKRVVRYMMNYKGALKDIAITKEELVFAYSKHIANSLSISDQNVLFIPALNPKDYEYSDGKRSGTCVYLGKYFDFHEGKEHGVTKDSVKIFRPEAKNFIKNAKIHSNLEIRQLLQKSELCYVYENSAIAIESVLCGCPVVFIENKFMKKEQMHLSRFELGVDGYSFSTKKTDIEKARSSVKQGKENYIKTFKIFESQFDYFIKKIRSCKSTISTYSNKSVKVVDNNRSILGQEVSEKQFIMSKKLDFRELKDETIYIIDKRLYAEKLAMIESYDKRNFESRIKLLGSNKRIIINSKIKIKANNFGRSLKELVFKNK